MTTTVINIGYGASYIVNVKDVTPLLEILNRSTPVDRRWADGAYWVLKNPEKSSGKLTLEQDSCPIISEDEFDEIAEKVKQEREAKEAKEKEEAERF